MIARLFAIVLLFGASLPAVAQDSLPPAPYAYRQLDDPALEARAQALMETLRCLKCQSQSIADSDAPMAGDMRHQVRTRIAAGEDPEHIRAWLVERYGDYVSYKPTVSATTWPLFAVPVVLLVLALLILPAQVAGRAVSWLLAIVLALAAFAVAVLAFRVERRGWTTIAAALALGLAGYALQASPGIPGDPAAPAAERGEAGWALVDERREMFAFGDRSSSDKLIIADGFARRGQFADAAVILRGAVADNPRDAEAWLALGNALVEHAGGALTEPALLAYRRAAELDPEGTGTGYFLGLALIRQGRLGEAGALWRSTLEAAAEDAAGREVLALRLARLETLLSQPGGPTTVPK